MPTGVRSRLLPGSGVAVFAPWLVIGGGGTALIRLDLRLLDRVRTRPEEDANADADRSADIVITCGDLDVALHIDEGSERARQIVEESEPWTRGNFKAEDGMAEQPPFVAKIDAAKIDRLTGPASYGRLVVGSSTIDDDDDDSDDLAGFIYELTEPEMVLGRTMDNDIIIRHGSISRKHAKITRDPSSGRYTITDLHAENGVYVNAERCIAVELNGGDIITLGSIALVFMAPGERVDQFWTTPTSPDAEQFLFIGNDPVVLRGAELHVGSFAIRVEEVLEQALRGANLPLGGRRFLQAAMALLVVALAERREYERSQTPNT